MNFVLEPWFYYAETLKPSLDHLIFSVKSSYHVRMACPDICLVFLSVSALEVREKILHLRNIEMRERHESFIETIK